MIQNKFSELVFSENDICDLLMKGRDIDLLKHIVVDPSIKIEELVMHVDRPESLLTWTFPYDKESVQGFHESQQLMWHMPNEYKKLDIAEYILSLCNTEEELQRCGSELLMYQERNLFELLKYLKFLVDVMIENNVIWGVGRGSSVSSYILYKLGVHQIDSMYYNLDIAEFLR